MKWATLTMIAVLVAQACAVNGAETYSKLWSRGGENWTPDSRLPDFSYAGYRAGAAALPEPKATLNVRDFGATGDGKSDDSKALLGAIAAAEGKVVEIPPGEYRITEILEIRTAGTILRGAGPDKTILFFPTPLNEIKPNWGATTGGRRTSNYSWSGGFVWFRGSFQSEKIADIEPPAERGSTRLRLSSSDGLTVGQRVEIYQQDTPENSLAHYLYAGDPGDTRKLNGRTRTSMVVWIDAIEAGEIRFHPALRFDIRTEWKPQVRRFEPTVSDSGVEHLTLRYPVTDYKGHFTELGYNGVALSGVADCWVRDVRIENPDSGIFVGGKFCTLTDVKVTSRRAVDGQNCTGHHGITLGGTDNLLTGFDLRTRFIHDITVTNGSSHNVASSGKGVDLSFDHHKRAPYENLFTDIDIGEGTRPWKCGGGASLGKHCAARETWWNIRSKRPVSPPSSNFAPPALNLVGLTTDDPAQCDPEGQWWEAIPPEDLRPANLHEAQLARRLRGEAVSR